MLALAITDLKSFMNKLLIGEVFDKFLLTEASVTTFNVFTIDGRLQQDFFDTDALDEFSQNAQAYSLWKDVRPFCYSIIRGKRTPLHFKIVFQLPAAQTASAVTHAELGISPEEVRGLYLNLQYKNNTLLCTTGTSLSTFMPGKHLDQLWDGMVLDFFRQKQIVFEQM